MGDSDRSAEEDFAWVYNRQWGPKFSWRWISILDSLVLKDLPAGAHILDMCCRTGHLARALIDRGFRVTGMDASEHMLRCARENAPEAQFVLDDARTFVSEHKFDAAVATFDSLNQVMTLGELESVFCKVHDSLHEGGVFLFDVNTERGYREEWQELFGITERHYACVVQPSYSAGERMARFHATMFFRDWDTGEWSRSEITLTQRWYPDEEVQAALAASGFEDISVHAYSKTRGLVPVTAATLRAFYLCRRCTVVI